MAQPRSDVLVFIAGAVVMLMALLLVWTVWPGRSSPGEAVRVAASALPDFRPRLPENPRLPTPMPLRR